MNKIPSILVNSGYKVDANGVMIGMEIPAIVRTQNKPTVVTTYAEVINWIPSDSASLVEFNAPKATSFSGVSFFKGFTALTTARIDGLVTYDMTSSQAYSAGLFYGCTALTTISCKSLETCIITGSNTETYRGMFLGCTGLTTATFPKLKQIKHGGNYNGMFYGCTGLQTVSMPLLESVTTPAGSNWNSYGGIFYNCTSLENVQLGSEGHAVTELKSDTFANCTQSGLTITVYTQGGASLANEPWGATGADIEYEEA